MHWVGDSWADPLLRHIAEIGGGRCSITDATIEAATSLEMRQILLGLLLLHEDLVYERAERERLMIELEQALEARDQFLAIASHELRTPITTLSLQIDCVKALVERQRAGDTASPLETRHLPVLKRQVDRLTALILEMLDVARINTGHLELKPSPVELCELVAEVLERFEAEVRRRGVELRTVLDGPVTGSWDAGRLDQVITNLVSNALRYGERRPIEVSVGRARGLALVAVCDHGIGISEADQEKIFAPFARAVSTDHIAGLGLGLWISQQIIEASGGHIHVESVPGEGSTFVVELPLSA